MGRGSSKAGGGESAIKNALAGNKADLDYAVMMAHKYGSITGGGTKQTREQFEKWNDEVKRLRQERQLIESIPKVKNPAGIPDNAMTEDEYLTGRGVGDVVSGYGVDRYGGANMTRMTERQRQATYAGIEKGSAAYYEQRTAARADYKSLVNKGILRDKTSIEKTITRAHGNPDNSSTQAARRMAEKKGIDWRTGKKLKKSK